MWGLVRRAIGRARRAPMVSGAESARFAEVAEVNYRQLAANLPQTSVLAVDLELRYLLAEGEGRFDGVRSSRTGRELVGQLAHEALSPAMWEVAGPHYLAALAGEMSEFDAPGGPGGEQIHVRLLPLSGRGGSVSGVLIINERVAERRQAFAALHAAQAFNEAVLAASPDLMAVIDLTTGTLEWTSRSVWLALGWEIGTGNVDDFSLVLLRHVLDEDVAAVSEAWTTVATLAPGESVSIRFRLRGPDGTQRWIACRATPFGRGESASGSRALAALHDVTDLVGVEQRLTHAALHDPLTGLANRPRLVAAISAAVGRVEDGVGGPALLFCDLDGFKRINDTYGHGAGDAVLIEVARRLQDSLRADDFVARVGGDEFVVLLAPGRRDESAQESVAASTSTFYSLAKRIQDRVAGPIAVDGTGLEVTVSLEVSVSIGIAEVGRGSTADAALIDADAAMYRAKKLGRGRIEFFDQGLQAEREARLRTEVALADALSSAHPGLARLSVDYQPIVDVEQSQVFAFEALARLSDQDGRSIGPEQFIPVAEDIGLIQLLDQHVLDTALAALRDWGTSHPEARPVKVAVNVSASQAQSVNLAALIRDALARHEIAPSCLIIELTETVLLDLRDATLRQLRELHELGVSIAIDDFGTGYASLQYLSTLPVDVIKVDRCFMWGFGTDPTDTAIVRAVAALALELGLTCIVEGVESQEQLDALPSGVHGQGFFLGRPHPVLRDGDQVPLDTNV